MKGTGHAVPMLDTRKHVVEFPDGAEATYAANVVLAEGMYMQCDENGNQFLLLDSIVEHKADSTAVLARTSFGTMDDSSKSVRQEDGSSVSNGRTEPLRGSD